MANKPGQPTSYTIEKAQKICARLSAGESLSAICKDKESGMPHIDTIYEWMSKHPKFSEMYARAREEQADTLADQILEIADENPATVIKSDGDDTIVCVDSAAVAHQKNRIDARKWIAAKLKPKKYAERVQNDTMVTHDVSDRLEAAINRMKNK